MLEPLQKARTLNILSQKWAEPGTKSRQTKTELRTIPNPPKIFFFYQTQVCPDLKYSKIMHSALTTLSIILVVFSLHTFVSVSIWHIWNSMY